MIILRMLPPLCALNICETPYLWERAGGTVISSLSALHTTPTSLHNVPLLAKWEIALQSVELDINSVAS